jgi:hypothetical protein
MAAITQVPDHFVIQYETNFNHLLQQMEARLKEKTKVVSASGAAVRFNQYGLTSMTSVTSRAANTPVTDIALPTRWAYPAPVETAQTFDEFDNLFLGSVVLPTSECMQSQAAAYNRTADQTLINALLGSATVTNTANTSSGFGLNNTTSSVALPGAYSMTAAISGTTLTVSAVSSGTIGIGTLIQGANVSNGTYVIGLGTGTGTTGTYTVNNSQTAASGTIAGVGQQVAVDYVSSGTAANSSLTIAKIREAKRILDLNEAPAEDRILVVSAKEIADLLGTTEVTSNLFNSVRALVDGDVNHFLGFNVIRTELLPVASSIRSCIAYQKNSAVFVDGGKKSYMDVLPTQSHALQIRSTAVIGASRLLENGVVKISCDTTK